MGSRVMAPCSVTASDTADNVCHVVGVGREGRKVWKGGDFIASYLIYNEIYVDFPAWVESI